LIKIGVKVKKNIGIIMFFYCTEILVGMPKKVQDRDDIRATVVVTYDRNVTLTDEQKAALVTHVLSSQNDLFKSPNRMRAQSIRHNSIHVTSSKISPEAVVATWKFKYHKLHKRAVYLEKNRLSQRSSFEK
jgi:hypothetical protein